jgi:nucleoside-diphosphate-sugar epimerase
MVNPAGPVLVTGARGFLGPKVVDALLAAGVPVVEYNREFIDGPGHLPHAVLYGELDDLPHLERVVRAYGVRRLVHLAAQSHPDVSLEGPLATLQANIMGTAGILEMARATTLDRVVLIGSESAYGVTEGWATVTEDTPFRPTTPYGVSKAAIDWLGAVYRQRFGLDVIVLRLPQIYGPGQRLPEDVHDLIRAALDTGRIHLDAGGDQELELIHVQDAARAVTQAALIGEHRWTAYNVSGGQTTLGAVAHTIAACLAPCPVSIGSGRKGYDWRAPFAVDRAREDLGFEPEISLAAGIADYIEWLTRHPY